MNKTAPEIVQLRLDIEKAVDRQMCTPLDFEWLQVEIENKLHEHLSSTTLKRLWGYVSGADTTRRTTLCILSQFLGYKDWEDYLLGLSLRSDVESQVFVGEGVHVVDLEVGDKVMVSWQPNRRAVLRYEGKSWFEVIEAENAKIHVGDRCTCAFFIKGQPMYLDELVQNGEEAVSYVAGSRGGLTEVKRV